MDNVVATYFRDISRFPMLTLDEEQELAVKMTSGDAKAREKLINSNLRLVVVIVRQMAVFRIPMMDSIADGNLGLIHAAELFEPGTTKFSTYAGFWIKQAIRQGVRKGGYTMHIPNYMFSLSSQVCNQQEFDIEKAEKIFSHRRNKQKSINDAKKGIEAIQMKQMPGVDLDEHAANCPTPADELTRRDEIEFVFSQIALLDPRETQIIRLRYGFDGPPLTLHQIGKIMGYNRERIRQLECQAIAKLKDLVVQ